MRPARVAIVGCGNVAQMHFEAYSGRPERVEVVAACDPVPALREAATSRWGVRQTVATVDALLGDNDLDFDIGIVCTPTPVRRAVVEQLARGGKHLFVEKPFADNWDEAAAMVDVAGRAGVLIGVNQNFRYHYPFDIAHEYISAGRIGSVTSILHQDLMRRQDTGWRTTTRRHAFSVMGVHWFDGLRWMLRDEATAIQARQRSSAAIDCAGETDITAIATFAGGTIATIVESFSSPIKRTDTVVIGDRGALLLTYAGATLYDGAGNALERRETPFAGPRKPEATLVNLELLAAAVGTGTDPVNSGRDNLRTIALLDAAYQAAETGETVIPRGLVPA